MLYLASLSRDLPKAEVSLTASDLEWKGLTQETMGFYFPTNRILSEKNMFSELILGVES